MNKLVSLCKKVVFYMFYPILVYLLLQNLNMGVRVQHSLLIVVAAGVMWWMLKANRTDHHFGGLSSNHGKYMIFAVIIVGCLLRMLPLLADFRWTLKDNQGDCSIHFFGAQQLAFDGCLNENNARYEAMFPYLYPYTFLLSLFVSIIKNITASIVLSNLLFDLLSAFLFIGILRMLGKDTRLGLLLWELNPFFIIMCWLPLAVIVVNTILMLSLFWGIRLQQRIALDKPAIWSAAGFGLALYVGNLFRPVFYVLLIAEFIVLGLTMLEHFSKCKRVLSAFLIILLCTFLPSRLHDSVMQNTGGGMRFLLIAVLGVFSLVPTTIRVEHGLGMIAITYLMNLFQLWVIKRLERYSSMKEFKGIPLCPWANLQTT